MLACAAMAVAGCRHGADLAYAARARHSAEVHCPFDEVTAVEYGQRNTMFALGCHTTAVYICTRQGVCRLDGEVHRDQ